MTDFDLESWLKQNWAIALVVGSILIMCIVVWSWNGFIVDKLGECGNLLYTIAKPVCLILTVILGYPLLKRKLVDGYITKQFDIIHEANRAVRKRCLVLRGKHQVRTGERCLTIDDVALALDDVKELYQLALEADSKVYHYSYLLYRSVSIFYERIQADNNNLSALLYKDVFCKWLDRHIENIYQYALSIVKLPTVSPKENKIISGRLEELMVDNCCLEIENLNTNLVCPYNSTVLTIFHNVNSSCLNKDWGLLLSCCFEAGPTPYPFAYLMCKCSIYFPPILKGPKILCFEPQLVLVGFQKMKLTAFLSDGKEGISYFAVYANWSDMPYFEEVESKTMNDFINFRDAYLNKEFSIANN